MLGAQESQLHPSLEAKYHNCFQSTNVSVPSSSKDCLNCRGKPHLNSASFPSRNVRVQHNKQHPKVSAGPPLYFITSKLQQCGIFQPAPIIKLSDLLAQPFLAKCLTQVFLTAHAVLSHFSNTNAPGCSEAQLLQHNSSITAAAKCLKNSNAEI